MVAGERILKFALLPNLRLCGVTGEHGQDLHFIQENRKRRWLFLRDTGRSSAAGTTLRLPWIMGRQGAEQRGRRSFYVAARSSWYPNLNGFGEKALYDLTFKVPKAKW